MNGAGDTLAQEPPERESSVTQGTVTHGPTAEGLSPHSPEARRRRALAIDGGWSRGMARLRPGPRVFEIIKRVVVGVFYDGFIHAGNLAYMSILSLFPFFITATAILSLMGQSRDGLDALDTFLNALPPKVAATIAGPVHEVLRARTGPLLWIGGLIGLWTVGSLIETIRDILRRAYGTRAGKTIWRYRLGSIGIIVAAVLLMMLSVSAEVMILGVQQAIFYAVPRFQAFAHLIGLGRIVSIALLFGSVYLLFFTLTPARYRRGCPKWPGALFTTLWWLGVSSILPLILRYLTNYDLTYGSLAGVMITLFFFYLVGLGVVIGAELNAALVESPEERDMVGQADDRVHAARRMEQGTMA